jgi:PqqD family protein of HPr-rel-A system
VTVGAVRSFAATPALRLRALDDGLLVFHPSSWDAHILNASAAEVLAACIKAPQSVDAVRALLHELTGDNGQALDAQCDSLIDDLCALGLVQPVSAHASERSVAAGPVLGTGF